MKDKYKIAIIGSPSLTRTIAAKVLSDYLKGTFIGKQSFDKIYEEIYHKKYNIKCSLSEIYTVGLAQFHYKIIEEKCPTFISDGSVLDEIIFRKLLNKYGRYGTIAIKYNPKYFFLRKEYDKFETKIDNMIVDYFNTTYDKVYLFIDCNFDSNLKQPFNDYNNILSSILDINNVFYKRINGDIIYLIHSVLTDLCYDESEENEIIQLVKMYKSKI